MTDQPLDFSSQKEAPRIGEVLRQARESASYSVSYVAGQTHLQEDIIRALENDQFDQLPGEVFTRGYIRSYAKLLGIDAQELLGAGSEQQADESVSPQVKKTKKLNSSGADPVVVWSAVTVATLLVGLLMTWWIQHGEEAPIELASVVESFDDAVLIDVEQEEKENLETEQNRQHQVGLGNINPDHVSDQQNAAPEIIESEAQAGLQEIPQAREDLVPQIIEAPVSGGDINKVRITVRYTEESWTEIFDARKRRLLHGLIKPGATRVISGQAPFNVFLGNSPGVQLEINGKPFDHSAYVRRNNTARFLIDDISS